MDKSIKLNEYNIEYNPVVKLKKAEMRGGIGTIFVSKKKEFLPHFEIKVYETTNCSGSEDLTKVLNGSSNSNIVNFKISEEEKISYKLLEDIQKTEIPTAKDTLKYRNDVLEYRIAYYRIKKVRNIHTLFNNNNDYNFYQ